MSYVTSSTLVRCGGKKCYEFIKENMERFPVFIPRIKELILLRKLPQDKAIVKWVVDIGGADVRWKEEVKFNDEDCSISFRMTEGDYAGYEGKWRFENVPGGTTISISAVFDWGIPVLGQYVEPVLERKAKLNFRSMLWAIRRELNRLPELK